MALKVALATGNWSNPAIWNDGTLPLPNDIVAANNFNIIIDQNVTVQTITNLAQTAVSENPAMTSNTTPSGIVTSSDSFYGQPWPAFDSPSTTGGVGSGWTSGSQVTALNPAWVAYEFTAPRTIQVYTLSVDNTSATFNPKTWTFEAWNGSSWVVLHTVTNLTYTSTTMQFSFTNTTAYIKYRLNVTAVLGTNNMSIRELRMFPTLGSLQSAVAGGIFILNSGVTVTTTGTIGLSAGSSSLIDFQSNGTSTINCGTGNIAKPTTSNTALYTIRVSGGGTLNVTGTISAVSSTSRTIIVNTTAGATLNFTGNAQSMMNSGIACEVNCTLNYVGNINGFTNNGPGGIVSFTGGGTLNFTGNAYGAVGFNNNGGAIYITAGQLNITGNAYGSTSNLGNNGGLGIFVAGNININFTGNIYGGTGTQGSGNHGLSTTNNIVMTHIGGIYAGIWAGLNSTSSTAIILTTGPFVSDSYGGFPFLAVRMHLIPTSNSYLEFRNSTTNGAFSPSPAAPAVRFLSPAATVDAPIPSNVRLGLSYALGTLTGTLAMPHPNNVSYGVPVDNTFGTAVLSPQDVWNYARTNLTTPGSIGERLKNVSTVDSTGDQLTALL
jgi:hypothetical protein